MVKYVVSADYKSYKIFDFYPASILITLPFFTSMIQSVPGVFDWREGKSDMISSNHSGTTIPRNGGSYVYVLEAFGPIPAFLVLWINILVAKPASQAIVSLTFANYLLQAFLPDSIPPPYVSVKLLTAAMICKCYGRRNYFTMNRYMVFAVFRLCNWSILNLVKFEP